MKTSKDDDKFDCIEMKNKIQEQIYKETMGMTNEEYATYIHQRIANSQFSWFFEKKEDRKKVALSMK
jgi:hypothetical protein